MKRRILDSHLGRMRLYRVFDGRGFWFEVLEIVPQHYSVGPVHHGRVAYDYVIKVVTRVHGL